jgi:hypothetical protein
VLKGGGPEVAPAPSKSGRWRGPREELSTAREAGKAYTTRFRSRSSARRAARHVRQGGAVDRDKNGCNRRGVPETPHRREGKSGRHRLAGDKTYVGFALRAIRRASEHHVTGFRIYPHRASRLADRLPAASRVHGSRAVRDKEFGEPTPRWQARAVDTGPATRTRGRETRVHHPTTGRRRARTRRAVVHKIFRATGTYVVRRVRLERLISLKRALKIARKRTLGRREGERSKKDVFRIFLCVLVFSAAISIHRLVCKCRTGWAFVPFLTRGARR